MKKIIVVFGLMLTMASGAFANNSLETQKEQAPNLEPNEVKISTSNIAKCVTTTATRTNADGDSITASFTACHSDGYTALMAAVDMAARFVTQQ